MKARLATALVVGGLAAAAPAQALAADPPTPLSPDDAASFTAGANIEFQASADPDPGNMAFYVSTDNAVDADGVLSNAVEVIAGDPAGSGAYTGGPSAAGWTKTPGTYYWQPVYNDCSGSGDCPVPAPPRLFTVAVPPPISLQPGLGGSFTAGDQITFRASTDAGPDFMRFYVSTDTDTNAKGVLLSKTDSILGAERSDQPGVYEATDSAKAWLKTPGTYYWQPSYKDCAHVPDCINEGEIRSFTIAAVPPPISLLPDLDASFTAGDQITFRASTDAGPDFMRFYVSTDTDTNATGVLLSKTDSILGAERSDQPGIYEATPDSAKAWLKTPGTYYWQPAYKDCANVLDCINEGEIRSFTIAGPPPKTAPKTFLTRHPRHRTHKRKVRFAFSSDVAGARFQCYYAHGWTGCGSPVTFRHVGPGRYRFKVRAVANSKTDRTPAHWLFRIRH